MMVGESTETETMPVERELLRREHQLMTPEGVLHTVEIRRAGPLPQDRRVMVMIPGTLANGAGYYDVAAGSGYSAAAILARQGFVVVLVDLPGTGASYRPSSGRATGVAVAAVAVRRVAEHYREGARGVDLYGETGIGTAVGLLLSREPWVRSFVASATFYRRFGPVASILFDARHRAMIDALPEGYLPQSPEQLAGFFAAATPAVREAVVTACLGPSPHLIGAGAFLDLQASACTTEPGPMGPEVVLATPVIDAAPAVAPALIVQGAPDPVGSEAGTLEMAHAYGKSGGGRAELVVLEGASHLMRFDAVVAEGPSSRFWSTILGFLAEH